MTWISLVCLLALSSSAFANYGQSSGYGSALPKMLNILRDNSIRRPVLPLVPQGYGQPKVLEQPSYGQQDDLKIQTGYGSQLFTAPKTLPMQGYGAVPRLLNFDETQQVPQIPIVTEADNLCRGQAPETVIPLDNGARFVVCLDNGKGVEQSCPKGLIYHTTTRRCERKYGPQDYCASQPCLNGGQCIPTESSYQCQCAAGFDGQTCELDARVCQTQFPCGQSPDARCQSFRLGAALQYICILQDGLAYGLSVQQAVASPCQGVDGPQALTVSDKGFIMCDGERMFVESCPGGTIWDDSTKACVWPDMQSTGPQLDQQPPSYGSYGHGRHLTHKLTYGGSFEQPKLIQGYGSHITKPVFEQPKLVEGYGSQIMKPSFEQPKFVEGYGSQIVKPILEQPKLIQGYGSHITKPVFEQPKLVEGYGSQIDIQPIAEQPKLIQGYGSHITKPVFEQPKLVEGYGSQIMKPSFEQPKLVEGYGSQIIKPSFEQPKLVEGYGSQFIKPSFEQPKLVHGYGSQMTIQPIAEQPKLIQPSGY